MLATIVIIVRFDCVRVALAPQSFARDGRRVTSIVGKASTARIVHF
ncbi:hypothetical protein ACIOHS_02090 [Streptomyces sp. NPDC088253]